MFGLIIKQRWIIWILALLILGLGFYLSWVPVIDRLWFARSGSLVVVLGIWSSIGFIVQTHMLADTVAVRKRYRAAKIRRKYRSDPDAVKRLIDEMEERVDEELSERERELNLQLGILEAILLMTGTMVWGFGDLITIFF